MRVLHALSLWLFILSLTGTGCLKRDAKDERNKTTDASSNSEPEPGSGAMTPDQLAAMHAGFKSCNSCHT